MKRIVSAVGSRMVDLLERIVLFRRPLIVLVHLLLAAVAYGAAYLVRFDFEFPREWRTFALQSMPLLVGIRLAVFAWMRLHEGLWLYVSLRDGFAIVKAVGMSSAMFLGASYLLLGRRPPWSVFLLDAIFCVLLVVGVRLALRVIREGSGAIVESPPRPAIIVGAGDAGEMLLRQLARSLTLSYEIKGFVDDDPRRQGLRIHGTLVLGTVDDLPVLCRTHGVQEVLIAIPTLAPADQRRILERCREGGVVAKTVPALSELLHGRARRVQLQDVTPEDLLSREAVTWRPEQLGREFRGRRILVTGAAGSVGSELCRQLVTFEPEVLVAFDRAESGLYFLDLELKRRQRACRIVLVVGDILDVARLEEVVREYAPDLVYHAAAYKHVPLMEEHPLDAITNNVLGTESVLTASLNAGVKKLVLISTDKAVAPISVMGMTKRMAECLLQAAGGGPTTLLAVRFGNILGSDGSVLPLFQWQISRGGPVTVTHPETTRYFMLLSEAAQLVLQAGTIGQGGEIFFLDMGEPIRILDLARDLLRLSGFHPGEDVPIELIGLRPGERLTEELVMDREELGATDHPKVFTVRGPVLDAEAFRLDLEKLRRLVVARDATGAVEQLRSMSARY
jgi:FlaA1/EpsC-like NDP-sugar epimerase